MNDGSNQTSPVDEWMWCRKSICPSNHSDPAGGKCQFFLFLPQGENLELSAGVLMVRAHDTGVKNSSVHCVNDGD